MTEFDLQCSEFGCVVVVLGVCRGESCEDVDGELRECGRGDVGSKK